MKQQPSNSQPDVYGYFGPDSITWKIYREPILVLGSFRALLLQIAHPAVATGVAQHSNFKKDALGRGFRTFQAMAMLFFGTKQQSEAVGNRLQRVHGSIKGAYQNSTGSPNDYHANDPALQCWVLATIIDTTVQIITRMRLRDLPEDWRAQFFEESKTAATILGIPPEHYPQNWPDFEQYMQNMLNSDTLGSIGTCKEVADGIIYHRFSFSPLAKLLSAGWLPAALCKRLGITVQYDAEKRLAKLLNVIGFFYRLIPTRLRFAPAYYQALHRIRKAEHKNIPWLSYWYVWLGRNLSIPLGLRY